MFNLFAFLAVLAAAFAAPAPAPAPAPGAFLSPILTPYAYPAALPVASSSQSIVRNYNNLGYAYSAFAYAPPQPAYLF